MKANSVFEITDWNETPFDELDKINELNPRIVRGKFYMTFTGELEGKAEMAQLKIYFDENHAKMFGMTRFIGNLKGKSGSFVFKDEGKFENGIVSTVGSIIEGSGTGDLKGISGEVKLVTEGKPKFDIELNYEIN